MPSFIEYILKEYPALLEQTAEHIGLTTFSLTLAVCVGIPLGVFVAKRQQWAGSILAGVGILQTIPSIALLGFMIPLLGIGVRPAIFALFLYALLPLVRNTFTGLIELDTNVLEAAKGMGMTPQQLFLKVELPLALPVIFAGVRTAAVINVGVATLAAYIAAGGLGEFIFGGIALNNGDMILAGAVPSALLAIAIDALLARLQTLPPRAMVRWGAVFWLLMASIGSLSYLPTSYPSARATTSPTWNAGFEPEFIGREDGLLGLQKKYNISLNVSTLNATLMYEALKENRVDIISGYATDGRIRAFDFQLLEDDRGVFPPYHAAPLMSAQSAQRFPEVVKELSRLEGILTDSVMTALNYQADYLKQSPEEVALNFVKQRNLLRAEAAPSRNEVVRIGSKIFTEQYILVEIFSLLITHNTGYRVSKKTGLGGTKICFDALVSGNIDLYPEYSGTGFLVMLRPPPAVADSLMGNSEQLWHYVKSRFQNDFGLQWLPPLGFNNTYALMVRREMARQFQLEKISDLEKVLVTPND